MPIPIDTRPLPIAQLLGDSERHLHHLPEPQTNIQLHHQVIAPWLKLRQAAREAGFDLQIASGFRSQARQRQIWNNKCQGTLPVYDDQGKPLDILNSPPWQRIQAILRWSALPGASRHHWGTDMDIYDKAAIQNHRLRLQPDEYANGGRFAPMMQWLKNYLEQPNSPDFFFPYQQDRGGVAPEPWHLSYRPLSQCYAQQLTPEVLKQYLQNTTKEINDKTTMITYLSEIYTRFIAK